MDRRLKYVLLSLIGAAVVAAMAAVWSLNSGQRHEMTCTGLRVEIADDYDMLQLSVYSRIVNGEDAVGKHLKRLQVSLPPQGSVRFLQVTEKQYMAMKLLLGPRTVREKTVAVQMTLDL